MSAILDDPSLLARAPRPRRARSLAPHRAFGAITLPSRSAKPRATGPTMVPDKNLGLSALQDLLDIAAGASRMLLDDPVEPIRAELDAGGATRIDLLWQIAERVDIDRLIFEAPQRSQQTELLLALGNRVNLGNVAPSDAPGLETLRLGLRSDTLFHFHPAHGQEGLL